MPTVLVRSLDGKVKKIDNVYRPARNLKEKIKKNMYVIRVKDGAGSVFEARGRCPRKEDVKIIGFVEKVL